MNIEYYQYSILATVLGMLVVFIFLSFLSLLMACLKTMFKEKIREAGKEAKAAEDLRKGEKKPEWLIAAVSAYLALEEEESYPYSAGVWKAGKTEQESPWVLGGKFLRRIIGV